MQDITKCVKKSNLHFKKAVRFARLAVLVSGLMLSEYGRSDTTKLYKENAPEVKSTVKLKVLNASFTKEKNTYRTAIAIFVKPPMLIIIGPYGLKVCDVSQDDGGALVEITKNGKFVGAYKFSAGLEIGYLEDGTFFMCKVGYASPTDELRIFHHLSFHESPVDPKIERGFLLKIGETKLINNLSITLEGFRLKGLDTEALLKVNGEQVTLKETEERKVSKYAIKLLEMGVGKKVKWVKLLISQRD